jgi:hypothetical protein
MAAHRNHIKVFVGSTVYDFQTQLESIYDLLDGLGYDVLNSHKGTVQVNSTKTNLDNCLDAVDKCDVFIGFVRPDYGSGVLDVGGKSITHQEFERATSRKIPWYMMADYRVPFVRSLFKKATVTIGGKEQPLNISDVLFKSKVMDFRSVELYNQMIKDKDFPISMRMGNWVQEYKNLEEIRLFLESQFKDAQEMLKLIKNIAAS